MYGFENRLTKKKIIQENQSKQRLKGKALAAYVEKNRENFKGDGDTLCVEAGYGEYGNNGEPKCDFKPFVKELSEVIDLSNGDEISL